MSKNGSDIYKACIGAPDNFMSTYYHTEFKKIDNARKQKLTKTTSSNDRGIISWFGSGGKSKSK